MNDFKHGMDPMELARQELDFAAMASSAPSIRDVMFKAQTMAPMPQPRRWDRVAGGAGAAVLALAVAFAPWLPSRTTYSVLNVQFEQTFRPDEAQQLVDSMQSAMPERMLLGAQYSRIAAGADESAAADPAARGMLSLSVSSFLPQAQMERRVNELIESQLPDVASPMISLSAELNDRDLEGRPKRHSPAELVLRGIGGGEPAVDGNLPGAELANELLANEELFAGHLAQELSSSYFRLEDAHFLAPEANAPLRRNHFEVESWPYPISVQIENYRNLTATEQAEVKASAARFFQRINLTGRGTAIAAVPAQTIVSATVHGLDGSLDLYSSEKLQALLRRSLSGTESSDAVTVEGAVSSALAELLPDHVCRVDYQRLPAGNNSGIAYEVKVSITGERSAQESESDDSAGLRGGDPAVVW